MADKSCCAALRKDLRGAAVWICTLCSSLRLQRTSPSGAALNSCCTHSPEARRGQAQLGVPVTLQSCSQIAPRPCGRCTASWRLPANRHAALGPQKPPRAGAVAVAPYTVGGQLPQRQCLGGHIAHCTPGPIKKRFSPCALFSAGSVRAPSGPSACSFSIVRGCRWQVSSAPSRSRGCRLQTRRGQMRRVRTARRSGPDRSRFPDQRRTSRNLRGKSRRAAARCPLGAGAKPAVDSHGVLLAAPMSRRRRC